MATEASRNVSDGNEGQSERDGRWRRRPIETGAMASVPVGTGRAMATAANRDGSDGIGASRNGKGDGNGGQSKREGRWQRRPIETGAMASVPVGTGWAMATAANRLK